MPLYDFHGHIKAFPVCIVLGLQLGPSVALRLEGTASGAHTNTAPNAPMHSHTYMHMEHRCQAQKYVPAQTPFKMLHFSECIPLSLPFEENQGCNAENVPVNT